MCDNKHQLFVFYNEFCEKYFHNRLNLSSRKYLAEEYPWINHHFKRWMFLDDSSKLNSLLLVECVLRKVRKSFQSNAKSTSPRRLSEGSSKLEWLLKYLSKSLSSISSGDSVEDSGSSITSSKSSSSPPVTFLRRLGVQHFLSALPFDSFSFWLFWSSLMSLGELFWTGIFVSRANDDLPASSMCVSSIQRECRTKE